MSTRSRTYHCGYCGMVNPGHNATSCPNKKAGLPATPPLKRTRSRKAAAVTPLRLEEEEDERPSRSRSVKERKPTKSRSKSPVKRSKSVSATKKEESPKKKRSKSPKKMRSKAKEEQDDTAAESVSKDRKPTPSPLEAEEDFENVTGKRDGKQKEEEDDAPKRINPIGLLGMELLFFVYFNFALFGLEVYSEGAYQVSLASAFFWETWAVFWAVMSVQTLQNATARDTQRQGYWGRLFHILVAIACFGLCNSHSRVEAVYYPVFGGAVCAIGLLIAILARSALGEQWRGAPTAVDKASLVTTGVYGLSRHPIYTGLVTMTVGAALVTPCSWIGWTCVITVFMLYLYKSGVEEALLVDTFGKEYEDYRLRVARIIPIFF